MEIASVARTEPHIEPFEERLAALSRQIYRDTGKAARTAWMAARLGMSESTLRWWCRRAERHGVLCRGSERGGWLTPEHAKALWSPGQYIPAWAKRTTQRELPLIAEVARAEAKRHTGRAAKAVDAGSDAPVQLSLTFAA